MARQENWLFSKLLVCIVFNIDLLFGQIWCSGPKNWCTGNSLFKGVDVLETIRVHVLGQNGKSIQILLYGYTFRIGSLFLLVFLPPQGFGQEAKTQGGTLGVPACIHIRNFKM